MLQRVRGPIVHSIFVTYLDVPLLYQLLCCVPVSHISCISFNKLLLHYPCLHDPSISPRGTLCSVTTLLVRVAVVSSTEK